MSVTKLKFGKVVYTTINITQHMITCSVGEQWASLITAHPWQTGFIIEKEVRSQNWIQKLT